MNHAGQWHQDILNELYGDDCTLQRAHAVLHRDDQSEEAFLGAQGVLLLHGLI